MINKYDKTKNNIVPNGCKGPHEERAFADAGCCNPYEEIAFAGAGCCNFPVVYLWFPGCFLLFPVVPWCSRAVAIPVAAAPAAEVAAN